MFLSRFCSHDFSLKIFNSKKCSRAKTVNENLKMSAALLSRFDLVFILLDKPDEVLDKRVSDHIMSVSYSKNPSCSVLILCLVL